MKLVHTNNQFVAISEFSEKDIPKSAGFRWDKDSKHWYTNDVTKAVVLIAYADSETKTLLEAANKEREAALESSRATDSNIDIPCPEGLEYLPFQRAGIAYALARPSTLIGDEMGTGKTIQAAGVINADTSIKKVLVICPASLRLNWQRELDKWLVVSRSIEIALPKSLPNSDVVIINYDILKNHKDALRAVEWDLLICDESHYLKNHKAKRTAMVLGKSDKKKENRITPIPAKRKLFLTGSPILNRPIELYSVLKSIHPDEFGNWHKYVTRYCDGHRNGYGWDVSGASNMGELQEKLRASVMVRRLKKDVLTELPPKRRQIIEVAANGAGNVVEAERTAFLAHEAELESKRTDVELAKCSENENEYKSAVEALTKCTQAAFSDISRLRHATALSKVPAVIDFVKDALESSEKIVLFCHHKDVIASIAAELDAVILTGDTSMDDRQAAVDKFQTDPDCHLFIGSIGAAGVGLTLTASSHVIFAELDWVPGNVTQAEDRCHRLGTTDNVLIQHLVLDGSLDAKIAKQLIAKQTIIDAALDDDIPKREPIIPLQPAASANTNRKKLDDIAAKLTPEEIQDIHNKLQILASYCDGAQAADGMGFNKIDANIGHSLAAATALTPRQAALGQRLTTKYRRQLL